MLAAESDVTERLFPLSEGVTVRVRLGIQTDEKGGKRRRRANGASVLFLCCTLPFVLGHGLQYPCSSFMLFHTTFLFAWAATVEQISAFQPPPRSCFVVSCHSSCVTFHLPKPHAEIGRMVILIFNSPSFSFSFSVEIPVFGEVNNPTGSILNALDDQLGISVKLAGVLSVAKRYFGSRPSSMDFGR